jgi:hypothetical protein
MSWIYNSNFFDDVRTIFGSSCAYRTLRSDSAHGAIVIAAHNGDVDAVVIQWSDEDEEQVLLSSHGIPVKCYKLDDALECLKVYAVMMA